MKDKSIWWIVFIIMLIGVLSMLRKIVVVSCPQGSYLYETETCN